MGASCPKCRHDNPPDTLYCGRCATRLEGSGAGSSFTRTLETPRGEYGRGTVFAGRFEVIEELGAGGMGRVLRAFDKEVGEEVAVKLLHPEIALDKRTVERFRNEIKLARKITHRNVCRMHELHQEGTTLFITMEFVSGQDLKGLIKQTGALTTGKAISIARQVTEGLAEAHGLGVIHRDLKPQNIMVDKDGNAKVMDFGIARSLHGAGVTAEGSLVGTPDYMSPEQVEGKGADQRSDIYALGVILFEMVTGRVPFEGDTPLSVAYKHKNELPVAPRKLNSQVPEPLNKVILRCLEKEKTNRYQTAEELLSDLALVEEGLPITERVAAKTRVTTQRSALRPSGFRRALIPGLAALGVVAVAIVLWRVLPKRQPLLSASTSGKPSIAILNFENLSGDPALDFLREGLARIINTGLAQSKLIYVLDPSGLYGILKKLDLDQSARYTRDDLVKVADEGGVSYISTGSLMKAGKDLVIMMTLQRPRTGEVIDSFKVTCRSEEDIYSTKPDELAAKIKSAMDLTPAQVAADAGRGVQEITTSSPVALKYYLESVTYYNQVDYEKARGLCEKAIELDPNFALPYIMLAVFSEAMEGDTAKGREFRKKAFDLRDRLSERDRLNVEGNYYMTLNEESRAKAIEAWEKYLRFAPRSGEALQGLGSLYEGAGEYAKSLVAYERAYEAEPSPQYLGWILQAYQKAGQLGKAEGILEDYYRNYQDNRNIQWTSSYFYIVRNKFDRALAEVERGFLQDPSPNWSWDVLRGDVHRARGDLAEAEKVYLQVISKAEKPGYVTGAKEQLIDLFILQGKTNRAREEFAKAVAPGGYAAGTANFGLVNRYLRLKVYDKALEIADSVLNNYIKQGDPEYIRFALWWKGIVYVEEKDFGEADKIATELQGMCQKSPYKKAMRQYDHLRGLIDLENGDYAEAIENIEKACAWLRSEVFYYRQLHALHYYPLALAYFKSGDLPGARAEFEKVTALTAGRWEFGDLYAKSFYWLGKTAEAQKDKKRAVENYVKFLDLWKDADPGQPEVDDAKARLEALR